MSLYMAVNIPGDLTKIGYAGDDPVRRARNHGMPVATAFGDRADERELHDRLKDAGYWRPLETWCDGYTEWFSYCPDVCRKFMKLPGARPVRPSSPFGVYPGPDLDEVGVRFREMAGLPTAESETRAIFERYVREFIRENPDFARQVLRQLSREKRRVQHAP